MRITPKKVLLKMAKVVLQTIIFLAKLLLAIWIVSWLKELGGGMAINMHNLLGIAVTYFLLGKVKGLGNWIKLCVASFFLSGIAVLKDDGLVDLIGAFVGLAICLFFVFAPVYQPEIHQVKLQREILKELRARDKSR